MDLIASINRGAPPIGLGAFMRADYTDGPWQWVAIVGNAANYAHVAGVARAAGKQVWLYSMPGSFGPTTWRDGLALLLTRASELGAEGIIVDPETGWDGADPANVAAFGQALQDAATRARVGITSYPSWGPLAALARASGDACFGIPQLYGQQGAFTQSEISAQWSRWRTAFGMRLIPGFALWVPADHPQMADPATYQAYLARLPAAGGAVGWIDGPVPVHMMQAVQSWRPGGNVVAMFALGALAWVGRPAGAIAIGIAIAVVIMGLLLAREVSRA